MLVLVDTSVWIDYFQSGNQSAELDALIDLNVIVTNDLILAELIPFLKLKRQVKVIQLLNEIKRIPLNIDWSDIIESQWLCLKSGSNGIGMLGRILGVKLYQMQNL